MMGIRDHIHLRSLWKTVVLLLAVAVFASPDAPVPLLFLYGVVIVAALLLPVRRVGRTAILRTIGGMSLLVGAWVALGTDLAFTYTLGFVLLAGIAIAIPQVYPDQRADAQ